MFWIDLLIQGLIPNLCIICSLLKPDRKVLWRSRFLDYDAAGDATMLCRRLRREPRCVVIVTAYCGYRIHKSDDSIVKVWVTHIIEVLG